MRLRPAIVLMFILLLPAACGTTSSEPEVDLQASAAPSGPNGTGQEGAPAGDDDTSGDKKGTDKGSKGGGGRQPGSSGGTGEGGDNGGAPGSGSGGSGPVDGGGEGSGDAPRSPNGGGSHKGTGGAALFPASGRYVYSQNGYEEFCAATCDRQKLPARQPVTSAVADRSKDSALVVTEMRSSGSRLTRTTTRYSRASADITEVYIKFSYGGYGFDQTYRPQPAVESLRFPMVGGDSWSGSWKGAVSGDYQVSVAGNETVTAGGRSVNAVKLQTRTRFRGDFEGTANATVWVDPRTKAIVKTAGNLAVDSNFGSYSTAFSTALVSGPGY